MKFIEDIIEENINQLQCSTCKHYLTVRPILTNIQNGKNVCGRCETPSNLFTRNHYFERFASQFMFPCKYASDGCNAIRPFENVSKHEKSCFFYILQCSCFWSGNLLELKSHYEKHHEEFVIKDGDTVTPKENITRFLFIHQNVPFFINCKYLTDSLSLEIIGLSAYNECNAVFTCTLVESNLKYRSEINRVMEIPYAKGPPTFTLHSEIAKEIIDSISKKLMCPHCSLPMTPPILRCLEGHVTCISCTEQYYDCKTCEADSDFSCDPELQYFAVISTFLCRWSCGGKFNVNEIRDHELACTKRSYQCFHYFRCEWRGSLTELLVHEQTCFEEGSNSNKCIVIMNKEAVSFLGNETNEEFHLLVYNCFIEIRRIVYDEYISISVGIKDIYVNGYFRFVADLVHVEDSNFSYNKTYNFEHRIGTYYALKIIEDDILPFGKDKPFKITVRVIPLSNAERIVQIDSLYKCFKNYRRY